MSLTPWYAGAWVLNTLRKLIETHGTQEFTSGGTFTVPAGVHKIWVTACGAGGGGGQNLDYPFDYAFDYFPDVGVKTLINQHFIDSNFRMVIYGACSNPAVYVAGHLYQVNSEVEAGEYLTIDSVTKKIYLTAKDGTTTNQFKLRNKESYIFKKIPSGNSMVSWSGDFGVDIILLEERSEPKWI
jgi:hypothetical protein